MTATSFLWDTTAGPAECLVCGTAVQEYDAIVKPVTGYAGPTRAAARVAHVACTRHGVERWCRENRPTEDPLTWERHERPPWAVRDLRGGRSLYVARPGGTARPVAGYAHRPDAAQNGV